MMTGASKTPSSYCTEKGGVFAYYVSVLTLACALGPIQARQRE